MDRLLIIFVEQMGGMFGDATCEGRIGARPRLCSRVARKARLFRR
jgi:hypothetical protein